ncbi:hypothetical protein A3850_012615 [Lewinella sp. 4G2]|nr:hypothetical protein A3850_012615 [Lewinella sp. 4G2]
MLLCGSVALNAQARTVTGTITDPDGTPLIGATVLIVGTTSGTVTDFDGRYSIQASPVDTLYFTYTGYGAQREAVGNRASIDLSLQPDSEILDEIVVVGYGTQKKVNLTGAISTINAEELAAVPVPNTLNLLQGQAAGVQLTMPGGQPGSDQAIIRIRGAGSIGGDANNTAKNNPLVLIDGLQSTLGDLGNLSPSEIESVSVLKDAASSAIYGARAANGVVLVTTKRGKAGKTRVNFSTFQGTQRATILPEFVDSWEYAELKNEARINAGRPAYFTEATIDSLRAGNNPDLYPNTHWEDEVFGNGFISRYDLGISGGTEKSQFQVNGSFQDQDGLIEKQGAKRYNLRANVQTQLSDRIDFGLNIGAYRQDRRASAASTTTIVRRMYFSQPLVPVRWNTGDFAGELAGFTTLGTGNPKQVQNPIERVLLGDLQDISDRITLQGNFGIRLMDGLRFQTNLGYSYNSSTLESFTPTSQVVRFNGVFAGGIRNNSLINEFASRAQYQIDNLLTYNRGIGQHSFDLLVGHSAIDTKNRNFGSSVMDLAGGLSVLDAGITDPTVTGGRSDWALQSLFGRFNYTFDDRYLFEANIRRDGSSRFGRENQYGVFPSFSLGWRPTQEAFLESIAEVADVKFRASWGTLGNQEIGNYSYIQNINIEQNYVDADGNIISGAAITGYANPALRWEETTTSNIGADVALWNGKVNLSADYFVKRTDGILTSLPLAPSYGAVGSPTQNAAVVDNSGWEFLAGYQNTFGKFRFGISGNLATLENEVIDFNDQIRIDGVTITQEGEAINSFYGLEAVGIFQTEQEVEAHATQLAGTSPGDLKYKDQNGDGVINDEDRTVIGNQIPGLSYGFNLDFSYAGFDFSALFQGVGDVSVYGRGWGNDGVQNPRANTVRRWLNRWTPENPSEEFIRVNVAGAFNSPISSYWLEDASYLRLKNVQLGYTFRGPAFDKVGLNQLRVYVSGQNLLTFTGLEDWDPERLPSVTNMAFHPQTTTYAAGLSVSF